MKVKQSVMVVCLFALLVALPLQAGPRTPAGKQQPLESEWNNGEQEDLLFMREEEKLARDVYLTAYAQWGLPIFLNISSSEQRHMDALKAKLDAYGLDDPVTDDTVGVFTNPELAYLYTILSDVPSGLKALKVGAYIEEIDILDLQDAIDGSSHQDIIQVYQALLDGSYNHLRAFVGAIEERTGDIYLPVKLSEDELNAILDESADQGETRARGRRR